MFRVSLFAVALLVTTSLSPDAASSPKIVKVLPHFLDQAGHHSLSPSLYERDAYQTQLRKHPEQISALRFDVQWKPGSVKAAEWKLRAEILGTKSRPNEFKTVEHAVKPGFWWENWSSLSLSKDDYRALGELSAWRITLWDGNNLLAEQKSFLW